MQYNLNIQRELTRGLILTVGFVGSRGLHLLTQQEANPPLVCSFAQGPGCSNPSAANGPAGGYFGFGTPATSLPIQTSTMDSARSRTLILRLGPDITPCL